MPGENFGTREHNRFSYAASLEDIEKGCARVRDAVMKLSSTPTRGNARHKVFFSDTDRELFLENRRGRLMEGLYRAPLSHCKTCPRRLLRWTNSDRSAVLPKRNRTVAKLRDLGKSGTGLALALYRCGAAQLRKYATIIARE